MGNDELSKIYDRIISLTEKLIESNEVQSRIILKSIETHERTSQRNIKSLTIFCATIIILVSVFSIAYSITDWHKTTEMYNYEQSWSNENHNENINRNAGE